MSFFCGKKSDLFGHFRHFFVFCDIFTFFWRKFRFFCKKFSFFAKLSIFGENFKFPKFLSYKFFLTSCIDFLEFVMQFSLKKFFRFFLRNVVEKFVFLPFFTKKFQFFLRKTLGIYNNFPDRLDLEFLSNWNLFNLNFHTI